jgi:hypothetical protein
MNKLEISKLIETDEEFIAIKRFDFNLSKLLVRYPNGCPDRVILQALALTEQELAELEKRVLDKLKEQML